MTVTSTCHTDGCENAGVGIVNIDPADHIVCGCCGVEITDKVAAS
jgi:hypothetical protein